MQKEQQKRPYLAPEIISVEFSVEKGMVGSSDIEYNGNGVKAFEDEFGMMMFISSQNNPGAYMGNQMGYFGSGSFAAPGGGSSSAPMGGGYGGGGYFGGGF